MYKKNEEGFTLLEILITISIIGIIFLGVANINLTGYSVLNFTQDKIDNQQINRIIMARIRPYIRTTTDIDISKLPEQLFIKFPTRTGGSHDYNGMTFAVKADHEFYYQKHYSDGTFGNRMSITSSNNLLIKNLSFTYFNHKKVVEIKYTIEKNGIKDYTVVDRIFLRNTNITTIP